MSGGKSNLHDGVYIMVDLVGDTCMARTLIVPVEDTPANQPLMSGALFISGSTLWFHIAGAAVAAT